MDRQEFRELPDSMGKREYREILAFKGTREFRVPRAFKARLVSREIQEFRDLPGL
jgi:hypothetical protein